VEIIREFESPSLAVAVLVPFAVGLDRFVTRHRGRLLLAVLALPIPALIFGSVTSQAAISGLPEYRFWSRPRFRWSAS
jgi:ABC-type transport system involved in cytochrome c biogenesis permease component